METLGFNSPSLNPENCRLNGDRKSHYVRKIKHVQIVTIWDRMDFLHEVQFSAGIGPAHFLAETTRPLRPRLSAFSPSFISHLCIPRGNGSIGRKILKISAILYFMDKILFDHIFFIFLFSNSIIPGNKN